MKIGACYIVKDEAEDLKKSLESLQSAADEIVVVNTGLGEDVKRVAEAFGAKLFTYPWKDHFAEARNFALEQMESPWIIFLDADEAFLHPEQVRRVIEEHLRDQPETDAWMIMRYDADSEHHVLHQGYDLALRILRNDSMLRYEGRIHEQLAKEGGEVRVGFADKRLAVSHSGYAAGRDAEKAERNLRLLEMDIAAAGGVVTPAQNRYLADCHYILKDYRKALECSLSALDSEVEFVGTSGHLYHTALECMRRLDMNLEDMLALAGLAAEKLPELPEFYAEQGMILCGMGRLEEAEQFFCRAVEKHREHPVNCRESSYFDNRVLAIVYKKLAEIYHFRGADDKAEEYFRLAFSADPDNGPAHEAYEKYLREKEMVHEHRNEKKIFLSVCYIVRNEAENLRRSLESIAGEADEILVVDTGSGDDTVQVAEEYGALCSFFPWRDDFSAARNFALEQAKGEWILFLDADEYFNEKPEGRLRKYLKNSSGVDMFIVFMRNIDSATGEILLDTYIPRLFRNCRDYRYVGKIHEQLMDRGKPIDRIAQFPKDLLILMHTGYSKSVNKEKAKRNIKLLLEELQNTEHPELLYMYLAEAYEGIGDEATAIAYAEKDITTGRKSVAFASRSYRVLLRLLAKHPEEKERRFSAAERAVRDFPEVPEFHAEYGECLAARGEYGKAAEELEQAEKCLAHPGGWEPVMFSGQMQARLAERKREWKVMAEENVKILSKNKEVYDSLQREIKRVPALLFLLERDEDKSSGELYSSLRSCLPSGLRQLWSAYEEGHMCHAYGEGYQLILEAAMRYGSETQLLRWIDTAGTFSPEALMEIGDRLSADEHWKGAFTAYAMVPGDAFCIHADFWYHVGLCLYHLGERDGARESLEKALSMQPSHKAAASWLKWIGEEAEKC